MQLVAYGAQDIYLTGNPQITFFKVVYRRHTNFAMESIEQTFSGAVTLGRRVTAVISRNGDLIKDMWLEVEWSATYLGNAVYGLGNALVKQVEVEIGGQLIDRQYGEWMDVWTELSTPEGKRVGYDEMVGNTTAFGGTVALTTATTKMDVPLQFWFNRNPGLALPLIALQYHEVKINLDLETDTNLSMSGSKVSLGTSGIKFWVDYIYLDTDERRRFAQVSHEYLIEQLQFTGDETVTTSTKRVDLSFNHPVKELIWVSQTDGGKRAGSVGTSQPCQFQAVTATSIKLQLNGQDRFQERRPEYFLRVQTYKHHTHMPRADRALALREEQDDISPIGDTYNAIAEKNAQYIYVYSFALNPEEHQPSGTCNFSRIDNATLVLSGSAVGSTGILKVFAVNYNVLRIMSGMGGLAYSN
jgi:hypothetical protein